MVGGLIMPVMTPSFLDADGVLDVAAVDAALTGGLGGAGGGAGNLLTFPGATGAAYPRFGLRDLSGMLDNLVSMQN